MGKAVWTMKLSLMLITLSMVMAGCSVKVGGGGKETGEIVKENLELRKEVKDLNEQLELRIAEVQALRQQVEAGENPIPGAEPPVMSRMSLGRYSGPISTDGKIGDTQVAAYIKTEDQFGRMMPVAGIGMIQVVWIPDQGEPKLLAEKTYEAKDWQDAYRSNFTGTHYTLRADLPEGLEAGTYDGTLRVTFQQADTGASFSAQRAVKIVRKAKPENALPVTPSELPPPEEAKSENAESPATQPAAVKSSDVETPATQPSDDANGFGREVKKLDVTKSQRIKQ